MRGPVGLPLFVLGGDGMRRELREQVEQKLREYPAMCLCLEDTAARLWCDAIAEALEEQPPQHCRCMQLRYFEKMPEESVQRAIPISRSGFLKWRADFLGIVLAKAAWRGLIKP